MGQHESDIETLHRLGLTVLEARVYSSLIARDCSEAKTIARCLNIAKCEVYRAISSLEKLGLIEKTLTIPSVYKAIPIKDATRILLEKKTAEYIELQEATKKLVTTFDRTKTLTVGEEDKQSIVISEGKAVVKRLVNQLRTTQKTFESISTWNVCAKMLCDWFDDFKWLTENKVNVRVLTDKLRKDSQPPNFLLDLQKSSFFEIRYYKEPLSIKMAIRDKKEVNVCFYEKRGSPNMWSNNPIFAQLATKCFEYMWNEATQD
jgi:sugar-specific transcriptional regulator TrmB